MKSSRFILVLFFSVVLSFSFSVCSEVPAILWNIKGKPLRIQPISAFDEGTKNSVSDILDETVQDKSAGLVVFSVDKLSMEDLALQPFYENSNSTTIQALQTFLDKHPFSLYPNVKDPIRSLKKSKCGVEDIYMTPNMEGRLHKSIASALENSCVVIVHLPHSTLLTDGGVLFNSQIFLPDYETTRRNVIGIFTSKKSSWEASERLKRKSRNILEVDENDGFINVTGCIIMYTENVTIFLGKTGNETYDLGLPTGDGICGNSSELTLTFADKSPLGNVEIKFQFEQQSRSWNLDNTTLTMSKGPAAGEEMQMKGSIEAALSFSYSCGQFSLNSNNASIIVEVVFDGFQIQPYMVNEKFSDSFNCAHWFTLPIWMGVFVSLLFITILNIGVYFLFQAKTMDRFDDPKGKTITVPQTD